MDQLTNVLFVTGEIDPFANESNIGNLTRHLPEGVEEDGAFETRIMMPRYGTINERKNRLHQVIRLCGTKIPMGNKTETLAVKVTAIPGTRCQVYFMDSKRFFKRKGLHKDKEGVIFVDNALRALFFARSTLETVRKLQWKPDVVHAFGWISGFLPMLLTTEYKNDPWFERVRTIVFTPDRIKADTVISGNLIKKMQLSLNGDITGMNLSELGIRYSDVIIHPPAPNLNADRALQFSSQPHEMITQATDLYQMAFSTEST